MPDGSAGARDARRDTAPRFEIEDVVVAGGQAYVLARRLDLGGPFVVGDGTTLGGCRVMECLDVPTDLGSGPSRHETRVIFCLADAADRDRLPRHAVVELRDASSSAAATPAR